MDRKFKNKIDTAEFVQTFRGGDLDLDWFAAVQQARMVFDAYTVKDLALEMVQGGLRAVGFEEWLDTEYEDAESWAEDGDFEEMVEVNTRIENELRRFYGSR